MDIIENTFKIIVKANSSRNEILGYDSTRKAYRIAVRAKPEQNKANIEIIKFLSKVLKRKIRIVSGLKSKEKMIKAE